MDSADSSGTTICAIKKLTYILHSISISFKIAYFITEANKQSATSSSKPDEGFGSKTTSTTGTVGSSSSMASKKNEENEGGKEQRNEEKKQKIDDREEGK